MLIGVLRLLRLIKVGGYFWQGIFCCTGLVLGVFLTRGNWLCLYSTKLVLCYCIVCLMFERVSLVCLLVGLGDSLTLDGAFSAAVLETGIKALELILTFCASIGESG